MQKEINFYQEMASEHRLHIAKVRFPFICILAVIANYSHLLKNNYKGI